MPLATLGALVAYILRQLSNISATCRPPAAALMEPQGPHAATTALLLLYYLISARARTVSETQTGERAAERRLSGFGKNVTSERK